jgi:hypothetical protein
MSPVSEIIYSYVLAECDEPLRTYAPGDMRPYLAIEVLCQNRYPNGTIDADLRHRESDKGACQVVKLKGRVYHPRR